jgi:hypothetical protein
MRAYESIQDRARQGAVPVCGKTAEHRFAHTRWLSAIFTLILVAGCGVDDLPVSGGRWEKHRSGEAYVGAHPVFSPDGAFVVYSTPASGHGDLYRYDRSTGRNTRLTADPEYEVHSSLGQALALGGLGHLDNFESQLLR